MPILIAAAKRLPGDLYKDGDVDGTDLALYLSEPTAMAPEVLAEYFGRNDCRDIAGH